VALKRPSLSIVAFTQAEPGIHDGPITMCSREMSSSGMNPEALRDSRDSLALLKRFHGDPRLEPP
jgi:hypothetical protein